MITPLFSVLHRFMTLSSQIAPITGDISRKWMDLALQLMTQAALELLSPVTSSTAIITSSEQSHPQSQNAPAEADSQPSPANDEPEYTASLNRNRSSVPGLKECFAFGYLPDLPHLPNVSSLSENEQAISLLFTSSTDSSTRENGEWTRLRKSKMGLFRLPRPDPGQHTGGGYDKGNEGENANGRDVGDTNDYHTSHVNNTDNTDSQSHNHEVTKFRIYEERISRLKSRFPFPAVQKELMECLEHFWRLNCADDVSGVPVLVGIEMGSVKIGGVRLEGFERDLGLSLGLGLGSHGGVDGDEAEVDFNGFVVGGGEGGGVDRNGDGDVDIEMTENGANTGTDGNDGGNGKNGENRTNGKDGEMSSGKNKRVRTQEEIEAFRRAVEEKLQRRAGGRI
jgi:hypothetical protein